MRLDAELSARMEANLVRRAQSGPNSNPPPSERRLPRVSTLSSGCARESYYYLVGAPEDEQDATSAGSTTAGQALEADVLTDLLAALNVGPGEYDVQVRVTTDWYTGSADLHVPRLSLVVDAKTTNAAGFDIIAKEGKPKPEHVAQLSSYGIPLGATRGILAYRATGNTKAIGDGKVYMVFDFPLDHAAHAQMVANARAAMAGRESGQVPPRAEWANRQKHWKCRAVNGYCDYRTHCWKETA